jgi:pimeloyl-ACP methyl ester carboxylesterase
MATFVLVHGAWGGGWVWRELAPRLTAAGHHLVTPTLTGLGDRAHLLSALITIETHIADVTSTLHFADLTDIILVGHSYGGIPITAAAERERPRIRRLIYLDALIPEPGKTVFDILPPGAARGRRAAADATGASIAFPPPDDSALPPGELHDWTRARVRSQPLGTYTTPLHLADPPGHGLPVDYLAFTDPFNEALEPSRARARARADAPSSWTYEAWPVPHDAPLTHPDRLASWLDAHAR